MTNEVYYSFLSENRWMGLELPVLILRLLLYNNNIILQVGADQNTGHSYSYRFRAVLLQYAICNISDVDLISIPFRPLYRTKIKR